MFNVPVYLIVDFGYLTLGGRDPSVRNQRNAFWVVREVQKMNQPKTQITQAKINRGKKPP